MKKVNSLKEFDRLAAEARNLFAKKSNDYGGDVCDELGLKSRFVDIWRKARRLKTLVWEGKPRLLKEESIRDNVLDLAIYCIMMTSQLDRDIPLEVKDAKNSSDNRRL